jgi:hypothetical protein
MVLACLLAACLPHYAKSAPGGDLAVFANAGGAPSAQTDTLADDARECVPYTRALEKAGEIACITGKVVEVHRAKTGVTYLDFCRDYRDCNFSVVVLAGDAHLRDFRVLQGREIRITGKVTSKGRRAEMRWRKPEQLQVAIDEPRTSRKK